MTKIELGDVALHRCGALKPTRVPARSVARSGSGVCIDVHCHTYFSALDQLIANQPGHQADLAKTLTNFGATSIAANKKHLSLLMPKLISLETRIKEMDQMGVDIQVIAPTPYQYCYWAERDLSAEIVSRYNSYLAEICRSKPDRLLGFGTVSLQYPKLAAEQLEHAVKNLELRGVEISTLVNDIDIADPFFDPFWAKADELGAVVFVHPWGTTLGKRVSKHYLGNTIGQPAETTLALSLLIYGGTFDRFPGLKLIAAHGGGYLPLYISRSDHAYDVRPEARDCVHKPSEYFRRNIWCDCVVYDEQHLRHLIDAVGADNVVVGTDYPYDMGHYDVHGLVSHLAAETRDKVLGINAARILGVSLEVQ